MKRTEYDFSCHPEDAIQREEFIPSHVFGMCLAFYLRARINAMPMERMLPKMAQASNAPKKM